jgi:hypothetical protein
MFGYPGQIPEKKQEECSHVLVPYGEAVQLLWEIKYAESMQDYLTKLEKRGIYLMRVNK